MFAGEFLPPELAELAPGVTASGVGRVVQIFNPPGDALQALYSRALALVFPSRFEGFGWPLIEAQACGCPVACGDTPALAEVAGDSAFVAPAEDADAFVAHLLELAGNSALRSAWIERGRRNLARFQTDRMTDEYLAAYRDALAAPGAEAVKKLLALLILALPWPLRRWLLTRVWGYELHPTSRIGLSLVLVDKLVLGAGARIGHGNVIKGAALVELGEAGFIGNGNWITGFPLGTGTRHFAHQPERRPELRVGAHAAITTGISLTARTASRSARSPRLPVFARRS